MKKNILSSGTLVKIGEEYTVAILSAGYLDAVLNLQSVVFDTLPPAEKTYILPKDMSFFENLFLKGDVVIGVICKEKIIAQSIVVNPAEGDKSHASLYVPPHLSPDESSILQGVSVHPDFRGNGLMEVMLAHWMSLAKKSAKPHAFARVSIGNDHSLRVFFRNGFVVEKQGVRDSDGTYVYNLYADLLKTPCPSFSFQQNRIPSDPAPASRRVPCNATADFASEHDDFPAR